MTPTNGHASDPANGSTTAVQQFAPTASDINISIVLTRTAAKIRELIASLEVPFHPSVIEWRVTNTSKSGSPRGQVMPYADQRAYTDRLNTLVTPAGWTRRYTIHTSANFERSKDQKIVAKVLPRLRKRNLSKGPVPVLDSGGICITSLGRGSIWTTASGPRTFPGCSAGRLRRDGGRD
jgi:hypothetical protein